MNLLSLLTSSYFLSSSSSSDFHRETTWNPEETEPQATMKTKNNDRKAATSTTTTTGDLSNLTFSTFLTMKQGGRGDDQPTTMKSTISDYQLLEEPQWTLDNHMTYTISDLLDGSVFLY
jgi:DNA replication protein DnaD